MRLFAISATSALLTSVASAQDTFSFVLYDARSGAFVSAGGSCIDGDAIAGGAAVVSRVVPGRGVVHTQSYYHPDNQALSARLLQVGLSAKPLLDSLTRADVSLTPSFRQYVAVSADGEVAAFTGRDCAAWAGQRTGAGYAMAGNILLDSTVLAAMEAALLASRTRGDDMLQQARATLLAAATPGADRRCLADRISCRSAFLRLAFPDDAPSELALDVRVLYPEGGRDPIVSLLGRLEGNADAAAAAARLIQRVGPSPE